MALFTSHRVMCVPSAQIGSINTPGLIISKDTYAFITSIKTRTTLNFATSSPNAQRVGAGAEDGGTEVPSTHLALPSPSPTVQSIHFPESRQPLSCYRPRLFTIHTPFFCSPQGLIIIRHEPRVGGQVGVKIGLFPSIFTVS